MRLPAVRRYEAPARPRARWLAAAGATAAAAGAATVAVAGAPDEWRRLVVLLSLFGVAVLAAGLVVRWPVEPYALGALAVASAFLLADRGSEVGEMVTVATLLVAAMELAGWSADLRSVVADPRPGRRGATVTAVCAGAAATAGGALLVGRLPAPRGLTAELVGLAAVLALAAFVTLRRWDR